jgi:hypothetical protein
LSRGQRGPDRIVENVHFAAPDDSLFQSILMHRHWRTERRSAIRF